MSILDFDRRLGVTSSAIMELLTSKAMMASMPRRVRVSMRVPYCGRARHNTSMASAAFRSQNFSSRRQRETSGISAFSSDGSP